jgi:chromosome segregation ATPase
MQIKTGAMMMAVGCAVAMLTGCGVKQELFDAKVVELNTALAEAQGLKVKITDLNSLLEAEKAKARTAKIEMDDAAERLVAADKKIKEAGVALADEKAKVAVLERDVASAKSATMSAREQTAGVETELAKAQDDYKKLQMRFDQFEKNMKALDAAQKAPAAPKAAAAPKRASEKSALEILTEMGSK